MELIDTHDVRLRVSAVPINTSCFWYVDQQRCVNKGLCIEDENRQKCLCEETPCNASQNLGLLAVPAGLIFLSMLLIFGGCRTHCGQTGLPTKISSPISEVSVEVVTVPVEKELIGHVREEYVIENPQQT